VNSHQETLQSNPFPIGRSRPKGLTTGDSLIDELDLPDVLSALESRQCRHTHGVSFADAPNQTPLATPMPAPLAFGGWKYVHAERQTMTCRGAAIVDPMAVTSRGQASHEIRGAGETSEIAAHLLRWRAHSSAGAGQGAPASERRHAHFRIILFI
jgi:hypothetical protein